MEKRNASSVNLTTVLIVLLFTAVIVLTCVTFMCLEDTNQVKEAVTDLCSNSMKNIELNLRQGDEISQENLFRFHQITQVYPETYYADLSDTLLDLKDPSVSSQLSQEDRNHLADCIVITYDVELSEKIWESVLEEIDCILAPYLYP